MENNNNNDNKKKERKYNSEIVQMLFENIFVEITNEFYLT